MYDGALLGHILAMETQPNTDPFWLVRVVAKEYQLSSDHEFDDWGVTLECKRGERAVVVTKLMPSSPRSTTTFCDHVKKQHIHVPAVLLRVSDLTLSMPATPIDHQEARITRSRAAVEFIAGEFYYTLRSSTRQTVALKCRALDFNN